MSISLKDIRALSSKIIIPFHAIERDITLPLDNHRPNNDAEHSWALAFLGISLAPEVDKNLDVGKVGIFSTLHDIVEVYAGDTSVWASEELLKNKKQREQTALKRLKQDFPQFPSVFKYIEEYEKGTSNEAKFVYALDKFLNMLNVVEDNGYYYSVKYKITQASQKAHLKDHRTKAHAHPVIARYYDELTDLFNSKPEHFYIDK